MYLHSQIDKNNLNWFEKDTSRATLTQIGIWYGQVRSLSKDFELDFKYPITVIAGRNGSGKSTVLALAACAYHNKKNGFRLKNRKKSYYTFSDFFIQTEKEIPLEGIQIGYGILHNNWRPTSKKPEGVGFGYQYRLKRKWGRWNDYSKRINRTVVYLGIERIVPHSEKSKSGSYSKSFKNIANQGKENNVISIVSRILDRNYSSLEFLSGSRSNLATVEYENIYYSGFNMGAGENSLFDLISLLYIIDEGSLVLIDEIELGLHEEAQSKLIEEIKKICNSRKLQIICTSHSARIIDSVPPEGRIFLEFQGGKTIVLPGISSNYATGKLSGSSNKVLDVLVEDDVAKSIVEAAVVPKIRKQINIIPIGSHSAVMRHLGARFVEREFNKKKVCVILDGDQKKSKSNHIQTFIKSIEQQNDLQIDLKNWCSQRLSFLPGTTHPEEWIVSQKTPQMYETICNSFEIEKTEAEKLLEKAVLAGKHNELYKISEELGLKKSVVSFELIKGAFKSCPEEKNNLKNFISSQINYK